MKVSNTDCIIATILFFIGMIAFFNIDSAVADEKNLNTPLLVGGIVSILASLFFLVGKPYIKKIKK